MVEKNGWKKIQKYFCKKTIIGLHLSYPIYNRHNSRSVQNHEKEIQKKEVQG